MIKKLIAVLLVTSVMLAGCTVINKSNEDSNIEQIQVSQEKVDKRMEDINFIYDYLKLRHPNPYYKTSEESFLKQKHEIIDNLSNISDQKFHLMLTEWIASIKDLHTNIVFNDEYTEKILSYPIGFFSVGDNYIILVTNKENEKYLGYKVEAINNIPIDEVKEKLSKLVSYETDNGKYRNLSRTLNLPEVLKYVGIIDDINETTYSISTIDNKIEKIKMRLTPDGAKNEYVYYDIDKIPQTMPIIGIIPVKNYTFIDLKEDAFYIQLNKCSIDFNNLEYTIFEFEKDVKNILKQNNSYKKIIIDDRNNVGGALFYFEEIMNIIKEYQDKNSCDVYTLIGGNSVSAGVTTVMDAKTIISNTIVLGTPTGGIIDGFNGPSHMKLPNSPLTFVCSTDKYTISAHRPNYKQFEGAIQPDIEIKQTYEDFCNGIDTVVEAVLKM